MKIVFLCRFSSSLTMGPLKTLGIIASVQHEGRKTHFIGVDREKPVPRHPNLSPN
jgi:hypothetical protein